jgi:uncharacterized damage-inducible protein DinB
MGTDPITRHYQMMARYNRTVNWRVYEACSLLPDDEYHKPRASSFPGLHRTLNHILLADRIWMSRFEGGGAYTPPLGQVLCGTFGELRTAREAEDARISRFMDNLSTEALEREVEYRNSAGRLYRDPLFMTLAHFFNHQTHHRGEIHWMLREAGKTVSLDLHRIICPDPVAEAAG